MRRVLIVEDEFLVRIGIKTTINWKQNGYIIVGEAVNGKEALQIFDDTNPDIVITDIKMPIMGGLELIEEIKKRKPEVQAIILSNHEEFEYARRALRYGVSQYLLKSEISEAAILGALQALPSDTNASINEEYFSDGHEQKNYIRRRIHTVLSFNNISLRAHVDERKLFPLDFYVALRGNSEVDLSEEIDEDTAVKNIESLVNAAFDDGICCGSFINNQLIFTAIYPVKTDPMDEVSRCLRKADMLVRNAKLYFDFELHIGLSRISKRESVDSLFIQAETARMRCYFTGENQVRFGDFSPDNTPRELRINSNLLRELLLSGDQDALSSYISSVFKEIKSSCNYRLLQSVYVDLLFSYKSLRYELIGNRSPPSAEMDFSYSDLDRMVCFENVESYVLDIYRALQEIVGGKEEMYSHTIRQCKEFLEKNYDDNLSLDILSRKVGISKSYLSMVFKQEMGINFSTYLTSFRIEKAKELLSQSNLKIYEIAEKVGFSTPYYFSKVFKEQTGMSCKEYKDKNL